MNLIVADLGPFSGESKSLKKALRELTKALNARWQDDGTPDAKDAKRVAGQQQRAVRELQKAIKGTKKETLSAEASAAASEAIARLLAQSRAAAVTALDALAGLTAADPSRQRAVDKSLAKAAAEIARGDAVPSAKPDRAMRNYQKALDQLARAVRDAERAPRR
jgi:uncharacterized protein YukE